MKSQYNKAFEKHTPSAFILNSPFQLLCAMEAIKEFKIEEYEIVLALNPNYTRNQQLKDMLDDLGLKYEVIYLNTIGTWDFKTRKGVYSKDFKAKRYQRVFLCEYFSPKMHVLASRYATNGASLVYTDDGNSTISILKGQNRDFIKPGVRGKWEWFRHTWYVRQRFRWEFSRFCRMEGFFSQKNLFTIYFDIPTRKFNIYPNNLSHLYPVESKMMPLQNKALIVGTVPDRFCKQMGMDESVLEKIIDKKMAEIAEEGYEDVIYIPHGRDVNKVIPEICKKHGVAYQKISMALEYYLIKNNIRPIYVWGINSTALLNIKKMLPETTVVNLRIIKKDAPFYKFFREVSSYYSINRIVSESIEWDSISTKSEEYENAQIR